MIDKITDKMFEFITSKGFEALVQLKEQYNNQTILYGVVKRFGEGNYFKNEFGKVIFCDNREMILQIPEKEISPTLGVQSISDNIYESMISIFIGEEEEIKKITKIIAAEYLSKRQLTIKLLDLAMMEKESTEHILRNIGETREVVEKINYYNEKEEYRKKQILKNGLGRKMDSFISGAAGHYLTWIMKGNIILKGNNTPDTLQFMEQIAEMINLGFPQVTEKFYVIPVNVPRTDEIPFKIEEIHTIDYAIYMRTILEKKADDLFKISNYLPDNFIYVLFELLDFFERNPLYNPNPRNMAKVIISKQPANIEEYRANIVTELKCLGSIILKFKPMYNAYLNMNV